MLHFSTGLKRQLFGAIKGAVDAVHSLEHGVIYIFPGAQPTTADDAALVSPAGIVTVNAAAFVHGDPANGLDFDLGADGVLRKAAAEAWKFLGLASTVPGWFRHCGNPLDDLGASMTLPRIDGRIGVGGEMQLGSGRIEVGVPNTIDVYTLQWPDTL